MPDTQPKPFVFVLMPFHADFNDTYKLAIKAACDDAGAYCERVDEQHFDGSILERVYNQISKADLLVAEMTGRNANVFYEVGYAHALGKRVILLIRTQADIPFDLSPYPHIIYEGSLEKLKSELSAKVRWAVEHPKGESQFFEPTLEIRVNDLPIVGAPLVHSKHRPDGYGFIRIDIFNSPSRKIQTVEFKSGVLHPITWQYGSVSREFDDDYIPGSTFKNNQQGEALFLVDVAFKLVPGEWKKLYFQFESHGPEGVYPVVIRLLTNDGPVDFPFRLAVTK